MLSSEISRSDLHLVSSEWRFEWRSCNPPLVYLVCCMVGELWWANHCHYVSDAYDVSEWLWMYHWLTAGSASCWLLSVQLQHSSRWPRLLLVAEKHQSKYHSTSVRPTYFDLTPSLASFNLFWLFSCIVYRSTMLDANKPAMITNKYDYWLANLLASTLGLFVGLTDYISSHLCQSSLFLYIFQSMSIRLKTLSAHLLLWLWH